MKRRTKKIFSLLAWSASILIALPVVFYLALKVAFPESKLKELIAREVQAAAGWQLSLETINWSLAGRLEVEGVALNAAEAGRIRQIFQLDKAGIRFRLGPLLQKRLEISAISFDSPRLDISLQDLAQFSQPDSSSIPSDSSSTPKTTGEAQPLPLSINLHALTLNHFDLTADFSDSLVSQSIAVSDLNLVIHDLTVPRGFPNTRQFVSGAVRFFTGKSRARYQRDNELFEIAPELNVAFQSNKSGEWEFDTFRKSDRIAPGHPFCREPPYFRSCLSNG